MPGEWGRDGHGRREKTGQDSQGGGNREKLRKFCNIPQNFAIEVAQRARSHQGKGRRLPMTRYGKREAQTPSPPPVPCPHYLGLSVTNSVLVNVINY